jgi:hypothetical protein|tara:strand:+ start:664 stop:1179 length:516 start_codon:yes stop_codon:yes gene_type:complete
MQKILTPKGWRNLIVEEQTDIHEQRVRNFSRNVPDNEYISRSDAEGEGFENDFTHYAMGNNQKAHFDKDSDEVFNFRDDRGYIRNDLKTYMIIRTKNNGGKKGTQVLHHVAAESPLDAYNRGIHADMQRGTKAAEYARSMKKSIPGDAKVIPHKSGSSNVFREVKKLKQKK